jgi:tetratricopeptide (TPR) repeat protein
MRSVAAFLAGATLAASPALASDHLKFGPPPAWVVPQEMPRQSTKAADAPAAILLSDGQSRLEPGKTTTFTEVAVKLQKPEGLSEGNIAIPWEPAFDTVTVNKIHIIRGDKIIDVLANGQTFTIARRETNIDAATLDGTLTAVLQPEDLQVGDIVDFAMTSEHVDPTLKNHVETAFAAWNSIPVELGHVRISWPTGMKVSTKQSGDLPKGKQFAADGFNILELASRGIEPSVPPKSAPVRFQFARLGEISDFGSWQDLADLFAPLFREAAVIPKAGPLRTELETIRASSTNPKKRADQALQLVESRVRYVNLAMGTGGLVPASAETTWSRRFGDCKAKSALLIALLQELGIQAEPVLVNHSLGDAIADRLPMVGDFDHVIVRAVVEGKTYWLDGTRTGDTNLDSIPVPEFGWVLPLASKTSLTHLVPPPRLVPDSERRVEIDATDGLLAPARIKIAEVYRSDGALALNTLFSKFSSAQRDEALRALARQYFDNLSVAASSAQFDKPTGEFRISLEGSGKLGWDGSWARLPTTSVAYNPDFDRAPGPLHDVPFATNYPNYEKGRIEVRLPPHIASGQETPAELHETLAGVEYSRVTRVDGDVLTVETSERTVAPEIPYKQAIAAESRLRALYNDDVFLRVPAGYRATAKDLPALAEQSLSSAQDYIDRGNTYLDSGELDKAIADFDQALKSDPKNAWAIADRGIAYVWQQKYAEAEKDFTAAEALDRSNPVILRGRGLGAELQGDFDRAVALYSKSVLRDSNDDFARLHRAQALMQLSRNEEALADLNILLSSHTDSAAALSARASAYHALRQDDKALADTEQLLKGGNATPDVRLLRANIFRLQGKDDLVLREAELMMQEDPQSAYAFVAAARMLAVENRRDKAMAALDKAIAIAPAGFIYINRSQVRPRSDFAGRLADLDQALKLDSHDEDALSVKASVLVEQKRYSEALPLFEQVKRDHPENWSNRTLYAVALYKSGRTKEAEAEFSSVRAAAKAPMVLNNLCWTKATAGILLQSALDDCQAALKAAPDTPAYLDSLAMVQLRSGDLDGALATYNRVLASAKIAASFMGRAIVYFRKGDFEKAKADGDSARKLFPEIDAQFADYGLQLNPDQKSVVSK